MNTEEIFQQVMNENCKDPLHRFAELVRQDEREACAKLCDDWFNSLASEPEMEKIAAEIRARSDEMKEGIALDSIAHPEGNPVPDEHEINPDSLETMEIEIPMNERIKELAEQAGFDDIDEHGVYVVDSFIDSRLERFAELVRQDERKNELEIYDRGYVAGKRDGTAEAELYEKLSKQYAKDASEHLVEAKKSWQNPDTWAKTNDMVCALLRQAHDVLACASSPPPKREVEQEPVAWMFQHDETGRMSYVSNDGMNSPEYFLSMNPRYGFVCALYTAPPQRIWVGLTDKEIAQTVGSPLDEVYLADFRRVIAKLEERNT